MGRFSPETLFSATFSENSIKSEIKEAGMRDVTVRVNSRAESLVTVTVTLHPEDLLPLDEYAKAWKPHTPRIAYATGSMAIRYFQKLPPEEQAQIRRQAAEYEIRNYNTRVEAIDHEYIKGYTFFQPEFREKLKKIMQIVNRHYDPGYYDPTHSNPYFVLLTKPANIPTEETHP